ncbi:hypothetical protein PENVUL_c001G08111 [Penicillium vulpinum]|uniref:Uncharacterized protein n=1 Tax=Penicillium vulpinum TaxID=29845 RepID=A0A1V6SF89_9EURO|nr:hypothetical protein PENVUL_c001G08111 [Penicillium vulpinum]
MVPRFQELALIASWHCQPAEHADGIFCAMLPALRRSLNVPRSEGLAVWVNGRVQQADQTGGVVCAIHPAPGRSLNGNGPPLPGAGILLQGGIAGLPNTQMADKRCHGASPWEIISWEIIEWQWSPTPRSWRVVV